MSPAVVLRSKFVTPWSSTFNNYINYMDREDAKQHVKIDTSSDKENDFDVFYNFMDYMDDDEKQGELFTSSKDKLDDKEKQQVKEQFHPEEVQALKTKLDKEVDVLKEMYGEGSEYKQYKETKLDDLKKRMGNAILTEMRAVNKEERVSVFKQKIAMRRLHVLEKEHQQTFFQRYNWKGKSNLHVSVIRLKQAMQKTFHDYK